MSTLDINNEMLGQIDDSFSVSSFTQFRFPFSFSQNSLFSRRPPNLSHKNDDIGLIHRWIAVKPKHQVRN